MRDEAADFSQRQTFTLTNTLLTKLPPALSDALKLAVIPYWFDQPLLAALRGPADADGRTGKIFDKLTSFSFVSPVGEGRYTVTHDLRMLLRQRWSADRAGFAAANERAAGHLAARLATVGGPVAEELEQARVYHLLAAGGEAGMAALRQAFDAVEDTQRKAVAERLAVMAEEQRPFLAPAHLAWLDYFQARLHQLYGRWSQSRAALESLLQQRDLPPPVQARAQRALAEALTHDEQWVQAIQLYRQALTAFEEQHDPNAGLVMLDVGQAYVDMAINVWGQREPRPHLRYPASQRALDLTDLPGRLPILAYLALGLGPGVLRSPLSLARGLDWMIARLFVSGAQWYQRGEAKLKASGQVTGLARLQEHLARLYHSLGHIGGAAETYRCLLAQSDPPPDEYRRSRAQLGLGHVLVDQGRPAEGVPLLEQALPALAAYGDDTRQAQAHNWLGRAHITLGRAETALEHYRQALALYRKTDDVVGQTNVAHQLEESVRSDDFPTTSTLDESMTRQREQATRLAAGVTRRRYLARYVHPALAAFRTLGLGLLAVVLFCTAFLSIRVETGAEVWARATMTTSALASPGSAQGPIITPTSLQSVRLKVDPEVAFTGVILAFGAYMLVYTVLGVYLIARTPLRALQEGQAQDITLDEHGLACGRRAIAWDDITGILSADRALARQPVPAYSQTVVFGPARRGLPSGQESAPPSGQEARPSLEINGNTGWYTALTGEIARRAPRAPRYNLGYSVIFSLAGGLFAASLLGLLLFAALSVIQPGWLAQFLGNTPYTVADLRVLGFTGLLIPLTWWLVIAPLRAEVFLRPRSMWPWGVLGIGIFLTGVSYATLGAWRATLGLPGVIPILYAVSLTWIGAWAAARTAWARAGRLVALLATAAISMFAIWTATREVLAYDALVRGNLASLRAQEMRTISSLGAEARYRAALEAYTRALALSPADAAAYAGRGIVYGQLGRLEDALDDYNRSLQINPRQPAVLANRAVIYETLGARAGRNGDQAGMQSAYRQAIADLSAAITLAPRVARYYVQRGMLYLALGQHHKAIADFQTGQKLAPQNADVLNGLGWINYQAGSQAQSQGNAETARQAFAQAAQAFERAVELDAKNLNNYNGLGWAYRELCDLERDRAKTLARQGNMAEADMAWQQTLTYCKKVEEAFAHASTQAPAHPQYRISYGHALWLVSTYYNSCGARQTPTETERQAYIAMIHQAISEIGQGLELSAQSPDSLEQSPAVYYAEQGQLSYILYTCKGDDKLERLKQAIGYYTKAIEIEPDNAGYYHRRGRLMYVLAVNEPPESESSAQTYAQAAADLERAYLSAPGNAEYKTWLEYAARAGASSYFKRGLARLTQKETAAAYQAYLHGVTLAQKLEPDKRREVLEAAQEDLNKLIETHTPSPSDNDIQAILDLLKAAGD